MSELIAAAATAPGRSAIGILRLSGEGVFDALAQVFVPAHGSVKAMPDRKLVYGSLKSASGAVIDRCLATVSRAPRSYTGEDTAEIQCHGSPTVLSLALSALFAAGARSAEPGEFTKRAFLNGRLDLSGAEAVADLIDAETESAAVAAASQLGGAVLRRVEAAYTALLDVLAHFHAVLDYPDEDIAPFEGAAALQTLRRSEAELTALLETFQRGRVVREGVRAAIIGRPNAGKSSLLNALLGYERAIVTPQPGTTRDTIEEKLTLGGVLLRLSDTAGLREAGDEAERLGVCRAQEAARSAELVMAVFDSSEPLSENDKAALAAALGAPRRVAVVNKSDLPRRLDERELAGCFDRVCVISAKSGEGLKELSDAVGELFAEKGATPVSELLTNARQVGAVSRAIAALRRAAAAFEAGVTADAVLTDVEEALSALGEISGRTVRADVTARIFERFCVGK